MTIRMPAALGRRRDMRSTGDDVTQQGMHALGAQIFISQDMLSLNPFD